MERVCCLKSKSMTNQYQNKNNSKTNRKKSEAEEERK